MSAAEVELGYNVRMAKPTLPHLQSLVEQAKEDLAARLSIPVSSIDLLAARDVTWTNSSLGCPQPDMNYLMVLTDGYRVVLAYNDEPYYYHANTRGYGVICESPNLGADALMLKNLYWAQRLKEKD